MFGVFLLFCASFHSLSLKYLCFLPLRALMWWFPLQVSDRQSYLVLSLALCLLLGVLLCLQCCCSSSHSPKASHAPLPKSNHYPSPKRFASTSLFHTIPVNVTLCLCASVQAARITQLFSDMKLCNRHLIPGTCRSLTILGFFKCQYVWWHVYKLYECHTRFLPIRCFSSYDDMSLKRRVTSQLVRSKSFQLPSTEGETPSSH